VKLTDTTAVTSMTFMLTRFRGGEGTTAESKGFRGERPFLHVSTLTPSRDDVAGNAPMVVRTSLLSRRGAITHFLKGLNPGVAVGTIPLEAIEDGDELDESQMNDLISEHTEYDG
jgi:hypothetical protein